MKNFRKIATALTLVAATLANTAHAEGKLRIAEQFGIVYLLLNVAQDQKLIEKHGKQQGVDIDVDWIKLSGGSAVNDALLSGSIDVAVELAALVGRTACRQVHQRTVIPEHHVVRLPLVAVHVLRPGTVVKQFGQQGVTGVLF